MPIDTLNLAHQPDEPENVGTIEPDLNMDFEEKPDNKKELSVSYMNDQEKNNCRNHLNSTHRLTARLQYKGI